MLSKHYHSAFGWDDKNEMDSENNKYDDNPVYIFTDIRTQCTRNGSIMTNPLVMDVEK